MCVASGSMAKYPESVCSAIVYSPSHMWPHLTGCQSVSLQIGQSLPERPPCLLRFPVWARVRLHVHVQLMALSSRCGQAECLLYQPAAHNRVIQVGACMRACRFTGTLQLVGYVAGMGLQSRPSSN